MFPGDADGDALARIAADGVDLSCPRVIEFAVAAPDEEAAQKIAAALTDTSYQVQIYYDEGGHVDPADEEFGLSWRVCAEVDPSAWNRNARGGWTGGDTENVQGCLRDAALHHRGNRQRYRPGSPACLMAGIDDYIRKRFQLEDLWHSLGRFAANLFPAILHNRGRSARRAVGPFRLSKPEWPYSASAHATPSGHSKPT